MQGRPTYVDISLIRSRGELAAENSGSTASADRADTGSGDGTRPASSSEQARDERIDRILTKHADLFRKLSD